MKLTYLLGWALVWMMLTTACDKQELEQMPETVNPTEGRCPMQFIGGVTRYNDEPETKASGWKASDQIYLQFQTDAGMVPGEAIYRADTGWELKYYGTLQQGTDLTCEARFFAGDYQASSQFITLSSQVAVYGTLEGSYSYDGTTVEVKAQLAPMLGRIRFKGTEGEVVRVYGMDSYRTYVISSGDFTTECSPTKLAVKSDGYTPYLYVKFQNGVPNLGVVTDKGAYTRTCDSDLLAAGKSWVAQIPNPQARNNWSDGLLLTVQSTPFRMMWVPANTAKQQPAFLLAETETTEALYQNVFYKTTTYTRQTPKVSISYTNAEAFITHLYNLMNLQFELPTLEEWQFAAAGGRSTPLTDYAGSSVIGDVAWYTVNSTGIKAVKQKAPNELGLYDMCGNAEEFTSTLSNESYDGSYYRAGGSWNSSAEDVKVTAKVAMNTNSVTQSYLYGTVRLKLPLD